MFNITIMLLFMFLPIVFLAVAFVLFKRKTMNILMTVIPSWKKRHVVCHMTYQAGMSAVFKVIPNPSGLTQVGKYSYLLEEKYVTLTYQKRHHFVLSESNSIPITFAEINREDVIFQASEIQTALDNNVMEYLFTKKKEILITGLFIIATISMIALIYNVIALNELKNLLIEHVSVIQGVEIK